eukprot:CAMPEP_0114984996 /NCGR_PEP_ID=MMETSP0216-20121206/7603_1 /TAXON_ID=223996 /ORGANISM="Protocruzia adherens, Strain Boccale" /LENGTH=434 /DNA_ID=CAMNT_0002347227 /DNA_START=43 /DNA_END=1348 /DNA_ORIENTATION=-
MEAFYILHSEGEVLIERQFKSTKNRAIVLDFMVEYSKSKAVVDQTSESAAPMIKIEDAYCFYTRSLDCIYLVITKVDYAPVSIFEIIYRVIKSLKYTFKHPNSELIKDNFTSILEMIDEALDAGLPFTNDEVVLDTIIKPHDFMNKMSDLLTGKPSLEKSQQIENHVSSLLSSDEPWRTPGGKYTTNECYIDVIEYMTATIDKDGSLYNAIVNGEFQVRCQLSGDPSLVLKGTFPTDFLHYSMHKCGLIRRKRFEEEKVLSFTPPNATFVLMSYTADPTGCTLPFNVYPIVSVQTKGAKFSLKLEKKPVTGKKVILEELRVEIRFPLDVEDVVLTSTHGKFIMNERSNSGTWKLGTLPNEGPVELSGEITAKNSMTMQDHGIFCNFLFQNAGTSWTGTKVDKLEVRGVKYNPIKELDVLLEPAQLSYISEQQPL